MQKLGWQFKMKLYHGTNCSIETIDLAKCRPYRHFTEAELRDNRFEYLKSSLVAGVVQIIVETEKLEIKDAFVKFYSSAIAEKLENKKTGLYLESPMYIYELFKE